MGEVKDDGNGDWNTNRFRCSVGGEEAPLSHGFRRPMDNPDSGNTFCCGTSLPAGFDPSATDAMAVVLKGNHSEYELGAGVEWAEFTDPFSGKTFMALKPNYDASRIATAYELIQRGNELSDQLLNPELSGEELLSVESELDELVVVLQMLREVNEVYGIISL